MKLFKLTSPLGIALTVAGVVLAISPEARKATRRALVKGTAALLGAVDSVKQASNTALEGTQDTIIETNEHLIQPAAQTVANTTESLLENAGEVMVTAGEMAAEGVDLQH